MKIAIVDVAAETRGARTILEDFCSSLVKNEFKDHTWIIMTSIIEIRETENIICLRYPFVKKNWLYRLFWEYFLFHKWIKKNKVDMIISLQNKALPRTKVPQIVYFHNLLLVMDHIVLSDAKSFIYQYFVKPLTLRSLKTCKYVIVQAEFMKKRLLNYNPNLKVKVMSPSVKCKSFKECNQYIGQKYKGWIYPAPSDEYKQHNLIVSAIQYLSEEKKEEIGFDVIFTFKGTENKYAKKIYEMSKNIKEIKFVGKLDREKILKKFINYGLVITSKYESFPMPISEAMYYNAPIVCMSYDYAIETTAGYKRTYMCERENYIELGEKMSLITGIDNKGINTEIQDNSWDGILELLK